AVPAHRHDPARGLERPHGHIQRSVAAGGLDHDLRTALRQLLRPLDHILLVVVDGLLNAAGAGDGQLLIPAAGHDDLAGAGDVRKLCRQLSDGAVADHQHLRPGGDLGLAHRVHGGGRRL
ncbi:Sporulation initiation factor Spo0A C-terminal domain-containing protein, partial [Dysosmobacter welbionis]